MLNCIKFHLFHFIRYLTCFERMSVGSIDLFSPASFQALNTSSECNCSGNKTLPTGKIIHFKKQNFKTVFDKDGYAYSSLSPSRI